MDHEYHDQRSLDPHRRVAAKMRQDSSLLPRAISIGLQICAKELLIMSVWSVGSKEKIPLTVNLTVINTGESKFLACEFNRRAERQL
jgi:hypothetical protein